ncbi:MAG: beta-ketoacyl synthase N-terminal-like domain-containing protein, partial [Candidatus Rokuibacteriota bacterium]
MGAPVVITGVGTVNAAFAGGGTALAAWLAEPRPAVRPAGGFSAPAGLLPAGALDGLVDETEARRLSRVSQLAVVAARLALEDAGLAPCPDLGLVVGTEFGDLRSTMEFADGYLAAGPSGLSALLFPNTVMNTMAAATSIAVAARGLSLTLNEPSVAGELAVAQAAAAVAAGRVPAALAGGVDQVDPFLSGALDGLGVPPVVRGEGATFVALETLPAARARGARVLGRIAGAAWRALPARPHGV